MAPSIHNLRYNHTLNYPIKDKSLIKWLTLCALPLLISLILSRLVIHYFGRRLLDTPNIRSSHQTPTPRGGGIALAGGVIIASVAAWSQTHISSAPLFWLLLPAGL